MSNNKAKTGKIFVVSGPSGSGKTTLLKTIRLRKEFRNNLVKIITATTRKMRADEKNGKDYQFLGWEDFLKRLQNGEFIESQEIYGDYYATPKKELSQLIAAGRDALLCVDVKGALAIKHIFPRESILVFIKVADIKTLRERLHLRSSESRNSLERRLKIAKEEMSYVKNYDYVIMNDELKKAIKELSAIIIAERLKVAP
jgi:guanylate kinase